MKHTPPKRALRFLRWFCREDYLEEIEGDLIELFEQQAGQSLPKAKWLFFWRVIQYFRPAFLKAFSTHNLFISRAMLRHNFVISYRSILRNKGSFLINLIGLSSGLACALLILLWVQDEMSMDKFHEHDSQLFQVLQKYPFPGEIEVSDWAPGPLAAALKSEMPEVVNATAYKIHEVFNGFISFEEDHLKARPLYADQNYLEVFSYPLVHGNKKRVLNDKYSVVISQRLALKIFSSTHKAVGKIIKWEKKFSDELDLSGDFTVTGVFRDIPNHSTTEFDVLFSLEFFTDKNPGFKLWSNDQGTAALLLAEEANIQVLEKKMNELVHGKRESRNEFLLKQYSSGYLYNNYENGVQAGGRITYVWLFSGIAILILIIAGINFMNLSTARASIRLKEIGVKKTLGAKRSQLIVQFVSESIMIAFSALIIALLFVSFFLPAFNEITGKGLSLALTPQVFGSFFVLTLLTGLFSSTYPALYLSGFDPIQVLKGKLNVPQGDLWVRKGLVVFQFVVSVILIATVLIIYLQMNFVQSKNLGFDREHILTMKKEGALDKKIESFLAEVRNLPSVIQATNSNHKLLGAENWTTGIDWEGRGTEDNVIINPIIVNHHFIETYGIKIKEGRDFSPEFGADSSTVILNETAVKRMGLADPIGKTMTFWNEKVQIIGIAQDFHFQSLFQGIEPCIIKLFGHVDNYGEHIWIKMKAGQTGEAIADIEALYEAFNPGYTFAYGFLDEDYQALYESENKVSALSKYFAMLAILISCLGLFGLAAFTAERRTKEIGIRKVLGSSVWGIMSMLSRDFTKMVLIAILIALPVSYFIANRWLGNFAYAIELSWWIFIGTAGVTLLIAWLTVGIQTLKAARSNPVESLRAE